ncbi:MAG: hypothetical protein ABSH35_31220 [Isosphaeraceae bacterium]|jgi:hypothetical protein
MPDRASIVVILAEDQEHQNLVWHYLKHCTAYKKKMGCVRKVPLPGGRGCGSQYVRQQFPGQVAACRGRHASNLLIVITDADHLSAAEREQTLCDELTQNNQPAIGEDPIVILVPKWQVETWVKCLLGQAVQEDDKDTDKPAVTAPQVIAAASTLHDWARLNAQIGATCVDSLRSALPRWRRIG